MTNNTLIRKLWAVLFLLLMGGTAFAVPAVTHTGHAMSAVMSTPKKKSKPAKKPGKKTPPKHKKPMAA